MLDEIKRQVETSLAPLVGDILHDTGKLVRQEIALAKAEFREDFDRLKMAAAYLFLGAALSLSAVFLLLFSLVHGLSAAVPEIPLWGSYSIVTVLVTAAAFAVLMAAKARTSKVRMVPEQTIETIKESAEWIQRKA